MGTSLAAECLTQKMEEGQTFIIIITIIINTIANIIIIIITM